MFDFLEISERHTKKDTTVIRPDFFVVPTKDLMVDNTGFRAIWDETTQLWSTDEHRAIALIDKELAAFSKEKRAQTSDTVVVEYLKCAQFDAINRWHKYCKDQLPSNFNHALDEKIIFANQETTREDFATKKLPYAISDGDCPAYEEIISTLYSPEERRKIEWAIGAVVSGHSTTIQKFLVFYGEAGTGKSTILNIIEKLFKGYCVTFDAKALGSANAQFSLEPFTTNPLVAIQQDGDLSRIEDNTRLNSLVAHEEVVVNPKYEKSYGQAFKTFLFMGTNKEVKITDAKSGIIRRLIDVVPTGNKLPYRKYLALTKQVDFELGAIAQHCLDVFNEDPDYFNNYVPVRMLAASNDFYNFIQDNYLVFKQEKYVTRKVAWEMYRSYCEEARVYRPLSRMEFQEELKNYFETYQERMTDESGNRVRSVYSGFKTQKFESQIVDAKDLAKSTPKSWLSFVNTDSDLDILLKDCPAQYATEKGIPEAVWDKCATKLKDIDTSKLHYVKPPENHIVIDFDIPDDQGQKCLEKNIEAASKWPETYAELSKSGQGIHLHYIYNGDIEGLSSLYADHIEIKIFTGGSSLRRKLTKCCNKPVSTLSSGLPTKKKKMINTDILNDAEHLENTIKKYLRKEIVTSTKQSIDLIRKTLDEAYASGMKYDVSNLAKNVIAFAARSTHNADYCLKQIGFMKFKSNDYESTSTTKLANPAFFDVEVFPNLFIVCWKFPGDDQPVHTLVNPTIRDIEELIKLDLIGFNNLRYDNHMLFARLIGYDNAELYKLSKGLINDTTRGFYPSKDISATDIFDFSSKKQSLKKFEIELGIHHKEINIPWDKPVPEEQWDIVAKYCANDVIATEKVFYNKERQADFVARQILAEVANGSINDTTNALTTKIIFGSERHPQDAFNYRNLGDTTGATQREGFDEYTLFNAKGQPVFPGYSFGYDPDKKRVVSMYRGEEAGEGGYVYAEPGMYINVALLDIASMHPSSAIAEQLFGEYTKRFQDIKDARVAIKHGDYERAKTMLGGKLAKHIERIISGEIKADDLALALKIAINSVYGLTAAHFDNPFHDVRNKDNIVAKRGALFMINLKHEVQKRGFSVAHIKTDSIKVPNATPEIIKFVQDYGNMYGYSFEHEATYKKMCLVNDAVYIAKYASAEECENMYGYSPKENKKHGDTWTATGAQFAVPYVFKTLFSGEPIEFTDTTETKSVKTALYLDFNENLPDDQHKYNFVGRVGLFCPMKPGAGGALLLREGTDKEGNVKYSSVTGAKGYRWMEAEMVRELGLENQINTDYYKELVNGALDEIRKYGDPEAFRD